ncbi:MAG: EVE domain-containing protein [Dehalococcoidia bacterium]|nr:EVE domain-containing protein [Dehalococcoidia bacterium]
MGYHIFLISRDNFDLCAERGVYGATQVHDSPKAGQTNAEIISSFAVIKPGDFAFFYVRNTGVYGLWKITSWPFYDLKPLWSDDLRPVRVCFEPVIRTFSVPVAMADILDLRDKGKLWTFDLGAMTRKTHHPITTAEGKELMRLLLRNNPVFIEAKPLGNPYVPYEKAPLPVDLECDKRGRLRYEGYLNGWFARAFACGRLKELLGECRDYLNYVPTSFNKMMDMFLTHVTTIDSVDILHKFTCMELKTGTVLEEHLNQIIKYENWLTRKLADGDAEMVQSVLVGFDFDERVLEYWRKRKTIEEKTVRLITYRVDHQKADLLLQEVSD